MYAHVFKIHSVCSMAGKLHMFLFLLELILLNFSKCYVDDCRDRPNHLISLMALLASVCSIKAHAATNMVHPKVNPISAALAN